MANKLKELFFPSDSELIRQYNYLLRLHKEQIGLCSTCVHYIETGLPGFVTDYGKCRINSPVFVKKVSKLTNDIKCSRYSEDKETVEKINNEISRLRNGDKEHND